MSSPSLGLQLRPATAEDAPRIAALVNAAYGHYVERIEFAPRPMTDDYLLVVRDKRVTLAERGGEIAGLIVLDIDEEGFVIDNVAVEPADEGTGVGRLLLEYAEAQAREAEFDSVYLYTHELMTENQALYARIGYVEYDRRRMPNGARVVFMRRAL